jgi:hypothetical protein
MIIGVVTDVEHSDLLFVESLTCYIANVHFFMILATFIHTLTFFPNCFDISHGNGLFLRRKLESHYITINITINGEYLMVFSISWVEVENQNFLSSIANQELVLDIKLDVLDE